MESLLGINDGLGEVKLGTGMVHVGFVLELEGKKVQGITDRLGRG